MITAERTIDELLPQSLALIVVSAAEIIPAQGSANIAVSDSYLCIGLIYVDLTRPISVR